MKATTLPILLCGIGLIVGPAAMAASSSTNTSSTNQQATTSGPAAGTAVTPNAAPYKNSTSAEATGETNTGATNGAGAPGVSAKSGTEAGPAPHKADSKS